MYSHKNFQVLVHQWSNWKVSRSQSVIQNISFQKRNVIYVKERVYSFFLFRQVAFYEYYDILE